MIFTFGVLQVMGSQRVRHNWVNELNWTNYKWSYWLTPSSVCEHLFTYLILLCLAFGIIVCPDRKYSCVSTILTSSLHSLPCLHQPVALGLEQRCWRISGPSWPCFLPASVAHSQLWDTQYMPKVYAFLSCQKDEAPNFSQVSTLVGKKTKQTSKQQKKNKTVFGERFRGQVDSSLFLNLGWK